jgi:co-chaperonin GroES (HSP10)
MLGGGDALARGQKTAQFAAGGSDLTDFEYDLKVRRENAGQKYGLSEAEVASYEARIAKGLRVDLKPAALMEELGAGIEVIDRRRSYAEEVETAKAAPVEAKKWAEKTYGTFTPVLDRILVKRCADGPDMKLMEDGSVLNTKTGLVTAAKYRQHSNVGIVLATGSHVILGGQRIAMNEVVRVGDKVTYGDYNSEVFLMDEEKIKVLCDAVQMNYEADPEGLRVVRVQDVRGVEREAVDWTGNWQTEFSSNTTGPFVSLLRTPIITEDKSNV